MQTIIETATVFIDVVFLIQALPIEGTRIMIIWLVD